MIAYLTSHIGGSYKKNGTRIPTQLSTENGLLDSLQKHWKSNSKVLIISADAGAIEINDSILNNFASSFPMSGLSISQMYICDNRNEKLVEKFPIMMYSYLPVAMFRHKIIFLKEYV